MATELRDTRISAKLPSGDMIAINAAYHKQCLAHFRNRYQTLVRKMESKLTLDLAPDTIALAELFFSLKKHVNQKIKLNTYLSSRT